jgi:hypothetical protein
MNNYLYGLLARRPPFASGSEIAARVPMSLRVYVETAGLAQASFAREKFSESAGLAELVASLQFVRFALSNAVVMLRRIYEGRPPDMDLDAYLGGKYEKILSRTQQAVTFFSDEAMIAYAHSFGPSKETFVAYMKIIIGHLDLSHDHPPLTNELAEMPRELAQLVDPALITVFSLLSDAAQAALVGTFECVSSATIDTLFKVTDAVETAYAAHSQDAQTWIQNLQKLSKEAAPTYPNLQSTCNRALVAVGGLVALLNGLASLAPQTDVIPLVLHESSELQGLLTNRLVPWDISFPGATASLGTAADGIKFLVQQSNSKGSAFYMPNHEIAVSQQEWENYLAKLLDMPLHYQMSAERIIHGATGHLLSCHYDIILSFYYTAKSIHVA